MDLSAGLNVKKVEGAYLVGETRVSLDSLVFLFREGMSAESLVDAYPALTLEQVHGALAFYLAKQKELDAHLFSNVSVPPRCNTAGRGERIPN